MPQLGSDDKAYMKGKREVELPRLIQPWLSHLRSYCALLSQPSGRGRRSERSKEDLREHSRKSFSKSRRKVWDKTRTCGVGSLSLSETHLRNRPGAEVRVVGPRVSC